MSDLESCVRHAIAEEIQAKQDHDKVVATVPFDWDRMVEVRTTMWAAENRVDKLQLELRISEWGHYPSHP